MERRPAPDHVTASPASAKVLVKAASVRISVLALLCITPVVWFAASELPDSAPYYLWGGVTALVLTGGRPGEIYHIGGSTELSNRDLTGVLLQACGADWDSVQNVTDRKGHDRRYALNDTKIRTELGYAPRVDFAEGLAATVAWYRDHEQWWRPLRRDEAP